MANVIGEVLFIRKEVARHTQKAFCDGVSCWVGLSGTLIGEFRIIG